MATPRPFTVTPQLGSLRPLAELDLADDALVEGCDVTGPGAPGATASLVDLAESRLTGLSLAGARLRKLSVTDVAIGTCDLAVVRAEESSWLRTTVLDSRLSGIDLSGATCQLVGCELVLGNESLWRFATLRQVRFTGCSLQQADFTGSTLTDVEFVDCDLTRADFSQVRAQRVLLRDCTLTGLAGIGSLRGATIVLADPLDGLALLGPMAADLGIALA